jgi:hypothetical protein
LPYHCPGKLIQSGRRILSVRHLAFVQPNHSAFFFDLRRSANDVFSWASIDCARTLLLTASRRSVSFRWWRDACCARTRNSLAHLRWIDAEGTADLVSLSILNRWSRGFAARRFSFLGADLPTIPAHCSSRFMAYRLPSSFFGNLFMYSRRYACPSGGSICPVGEEEATGISTDCPADSTTTRHVASSRSWAGGGRERHRLAATSQRAWQRL